jgi:hypothetical protein
MINWGDWRQMPDYRQFINQNKHSSPVAQIARALDPTTMIPGAQAIANPIHDAATAGIETGNKVLSPVVGAAQKFTEMTTPGLKQVQNAVPITKDIDRFVREKPIDAAGIAAATYFSGGAAGGMFGGAGGAGAGAGSSVGAMGGSAAGALQGGALSNVGSVGAGLMGSLKGAAASAAPYLKPLMMAKDIGGNLANFAGPDVEALGQRQQQMMLAERMRNDQINPELPNTPMEREQKRKMVIDAMMQQPQFFGSNY